MSSNPEIPAVEAEPVPEPTPAAKQVLTHVGFCCHDVRRVIKLDRTDPVETVRYGPSFFSVDIVLGQYDLANLFGDIARAFHFSPEDKAKLADLGFKYEPTPPRPPEF